VKLYLRGHDNKYAAEQMLLTLYPSERPEYPEGEPQGDRAEISRSAGRNTPPSPAACGRTAYVTAAGPR
jgi:oxygen-independent coproporphyrinogen-3 oxidase